MTIRRGLPDGSVDHRHDGEGWYYQLRGAKDWIGPFESASEAQRAYANAKRERSAIHGVIAPPRPKVSRPAVPSKDRSPVMKVRPASSSRQQPGLCQDCKEVAPYPTGGGRCFDCYTSYNMEFPPEPPMTRDEERQLKAEAKLRWYRGVLIALVVLTGFWWWASNRDPGPMYATQQECEQEHTLCDYSPARTVENRDGYTRHKAFWYPVDPN